MIQNKYELSLATITTQDLDAFEIRMTQELNLSQGIKSDERIKLPEDYRQFLLEVNGGLSYLERFRGAYGEIDCIDMFFYGYYPVRPEEEDVNGIYSYNLESDWLEYDMYREYLDEQIAIPIIQLRHFSFALLLLTGPEVGSIYEYNDAGADDDIVVKIANNFTELLQGGDYGIDTGEDFFFHRLLKKCLLLNDYQEWFDYLESRTFELEELENMLWKSVNLASLPSIQKLVQIGAPLSINFNLSDAQTRPIAEFMIQQGLSVHEPIWMGYSPLAWAAHKGRTEVVKYLISQGADIHYINPENGNSIIMEARQRLNEYESEYYRNHTEEITNLKTIIAYLQSLGAK